MNNPISHVLQQLHDAVNRGDQDALSQCYASDATVVATPMSSSTQNQAAEEHATQRDCVDALLKFQKKFNLTDYQIKCIAFAKGFIIGAILL